MSLLILDPGALATIQDRGRVGYAHLGVPRGGVLDRPAADLANRLVGNGSSAAVLETTLTGARLRTSRALTVAVTGATCQVWVAGRPQAFGEPISVPAGAEIQLGPATAGVRSVLAVAGGIDVHPVLGSRSTDTLAWVGPPRVHDGQVLPVGRHPGLPGPVDVPTEPRRDPLLHLLPGPRSDWVDDRSWEALDQSSYVVGSASNRIGLRLEGPVIKRRAGELPSEGIVLGAVQLPPSGQPVVFLHDHPTTGGYPVIAVVDPRDLPMCAQLRPGARLTLALSPPGSSVPARAQGRRS